MKSQLRVLHISPAPFGNSGVYGGGERYSFELARHMSESVSSRLVTFCDRPMRERVGKLEIVGLGPAWRIRGQSYNPFHPGLIGQIGWASVVHCHQRFVFSSTFAACLCRITGRPVFVTDLGGGGWDLSARLPSVHRLYSGFLHISCYSRNVSGHDRDPRAQVIFGGVDSEKFAPSTAVDKEPLVLFVGRLVPHKGVHDLIDALPVGLTLELIGRPYAPDYLSELKRRATGKVVIFRHDCDDDELVRAYQRALVAVLPSAYRTPYGPETKVPELLGQTLLEAMACGTPVICTNVASMPEVVANEETGFTVPPNDSSAMRAKLEWFRDHGSEAAVMGRAGRQRVLQKFNWATVVSACLSAYTDKVDFNTGN